MFLAAVHPPGREIRRSAFVTVVSSYGRSQLFRWAEHGHWDKVKVVHRSLERVPAVTVSAAPRLVRGGCASRRASCRWRLSSLAEDLSLVIMEAIALRWPVLSTCLAGLLELVQHADLRYRNSSANAAYTAIQPL